MAINWYTSLLIKERIETIKINNFSIESNQNGLLQYNAHKNLYAPFFEHFMSEKQCFELNNAPEKRILQAYEPYEPTDSSVKPAWLIQLIEAYTTFGDTHPKRIRFHNSNPTTQTFWSFFEPLASAYALKIVDALDNLSEKNGISLINKTQLSHFLEPAVEKIALMAERAFVLELRVAKQSGKLLGDTPTERFEQFFKQLNQTASALEFFEIYPILGRMACEVYKNWQKYLIEIVTNLYADLTELKEKIPPLSKIHTLTTINALLTDGAQTGGRSVAILTFNDAVKVVYKPRDSAIDVAYGQFLHWFNNQNIVPPIGHVIVVSHLQHSWCAFATPNEERTYLELPVMYTKLGALLCLMYLFDTIDIHTANLIVVGDNPILIDLETWLQPLSSSDNRYRSVRQTHLLPTIKSVEPDDFDLKGLTEQDTVGKTWTERKELVWENEGTDEMCIVRKRLPIEKNSKSICIGGTIINPADYTKAIVKGFRQTYRFIANNKTAFLEATGCFKDKKLRSILRGAKKYDALIEDMGHPSNLQDGLALDQFLDRLWIEASDEPYLKHLIAIEKQDLINLDSPYFYTYSDSKNLFYHDTPIIKDFFDSSALEVVQENVDTMSIQDLEKQVRIIQRAFAQLRLNYTESIPSSPINTILQNEAT